MITRRLVADDALHLRIDARLGPLVARWLPRGLHRPIGAPQATVELTAATTTLPRPTGRPLLTLDRVRAWPEDRQGVVLRGGLAASGGIVSLDTRRARLCVDPAREPEAAGDVYSMLTVATALLLAGLGRALVHAAAVVHPDGGAWLLVGDARSGKSTTCATLVSAGWGYLSDDQVVLEAREDGVQVEGWLRPFHLDFGEGGEPTGLRREIPPAELGLEGWRRSAPLAGVILPAVFPREPTLLTPIVAADALAGLVRQSPWLLACPDTAATTLAVLRRAAERGAFALRLGLDTYRQPRRLVDRLASRAHAKQFLGIPTA